MKASTLVERLSTTSGVKPGKHAPQARAVLDTELTLAAAAMSPLTDAMWAAICGPSLTDGVLRQMRGMVREAAQ